MRKHHQKLPATGLEREALRKKGQFWTPDWVAEAMVGYCLAGGNDHIFDPAVGAGAFFRAAKTIATESGRHITLSGTEIDRDALQQARQNGLTEIDLYNVQLRDFILQPPSDTFSAIVANPPYIRHHRLSLAVKAELKKLAANIIGTSLDGRAGLHVYFLLRALQLLASNGRLAFIMPADTCEGIFSSILWEWVTSNYRLEGVVTFTAKASPFPSVDTNPIIFLIKNVEPQEHFLWAKCLTAQTKQLKAWLASDFEINGDDLEIYQRQVSEGLSTGLSRAPLKEEANGPVLGDFAKVMRGIATGANEFFFLTNKQAEEIGIPDEFLIPAIGRTRDISGDEINIETIKVLAAKGKPTLLFSPDGRSMDFFPLSVREYLKHGEDAGFYHRTLIATRRPWYKMEIRPVPPILFAYLGRRNARFIRNKAGVVPLTGFLCVYPRQVNSEFIDGLWKVLQRPETIANLALVGKSYGSGAIKVEPRALENLPLPVSAVLQAGLDYNLMTSSRRIKRQVMQPLLPLI